MLVISKVRVLSVLVAVAAVTWLFAAQPSQQAQRDKLHKTMQAGNWKDAYDGLRKLALDPKDDPAKVGDDLTRAIQLATALLVSLTNRASVYTEMSEFDRAIADCDAAIRLDARHAPAYGFRGIAYCGKGDRDRGLSDFDPAIRLDPTIKEPWNNRADVWNSRGESDRAIADCDSG